MPQHLQQKHLRVFLIARAPVTSIGVFTYKNPEGSFRKELRLPEEVFNSDSLETLKLKPLTKFHPDEKNRYHSQCRKSAGRVCWKRYCLR